MRISTLISLLCLSVFLFSCKSTDTVRKTTTSLGFKEISGVKQYDKENYEDAFNLLKEPAAWGYKGSQYVLAFMFLKGHYVQQSTLLGMGWLGVAKEANVKEWTEQYDNFYTAATEQQKDKIDAIVTEYVKRYGLKSQDVTCKKGINAQRRLALECHKSNRLSILYPVDLVE